MPSIDELTKELTPAQVKQTLLTIMDTVGIPTTVWQEGSITLSEVEAFADFGSYCTWVLSGIASSGFLESATGEWLDLAAEFGGYGLTRDGATLATGSVQVTNATGGVFNAAAGTFTIRNVNTSKEYKNSGVISLANGANAIFAFEALEAGTASNAAVNEITKLTTAVSGLTVTNTSTFIAVDQESDEALRARCRLVVAASSPFGPADAYRYQATQTVRNDGTSVGVTKVKTIPAENGVLTVIVASDTGAIPDDANNLDLVEANLRTKALTMGPTLVVESAVADVISGSFTVTIYSDSNLTSQQVETLCLSSLSERIKRLPIGGDADGDVEDDDDGLFYVNSFIGAIEEAHPSIIRATSSTFTTDRAMSYNEVATMGAWTVTVEFRNRPS